MPLIFSGISFGSGISINPTFLTATQAVASSSFSTGTAITAYTPVTISNAIGTEVYSITPSLPSGLSIDTSTGQISGTPTVASSATTYTITASNSYGSASNTTSITVVPVVASQRAYTSPGNYTWVAPAGVTSVSVVAIGGASAGGGGLGWKNNIPVTPGNSYTVVVANSGLKPASGGDSYFIDTTTVKGGGAANLTGGTYVGDGGGNGGNGVNSGAGGGAGGYSGNGGNAGNSGAAGSGGGGGGGGTGGLTYGGFGGGVGILGQGSNGAATSGLGNGNPGSGGVDYNYGGGGYSDGSTWYLRSNGAVRIIWPGDARQFPSTRTADE